MIPLRDDQPRTTFPYVNYSIIAVNIAVFIYEVTLWQDRRAWYEFLTQYSVIPHHFQLAISGDSQFRIAGVFLTILPSTFMHGGVVHLLGNMLFLWIFGDNIEDQSGSDDYAILYLFC